MDFIINIATSMVPVVVIQLVILPYLGKVMDPDKYGIVLTLISIVYIIPQTLGNSLNNARLIHRTQYDQLSLPYCDYQILFGMTNILNLICCAVCYIIICTEITALDVILFSIFGILWGASEYLTVTFRLDLDYISYLINNICLSVGYLLGLLLFIWLRYWQLIYIIGLLCSLVFIALRKSKFVFEWGKKTSLLKKVVGTQSYLSVSGGLNSVYNYLDRLILLPVLGGYAVSVYYSATVFTKMISLLLGPLSTVLLSYISRNNNADVRKFNFSLGVGLVVAVIGYFVCILLGKFILLLLYPQYVDAAMEFIYVTSAASMISIIFSMLNPFVLKFCKQYFQVIINAVGLLIYVGLTLLLIGEHGIWGVCIASVISIPVKVLLQIIIFYVTNCRHRKQDSPIDNAKEVSNDNE